MKGNGWSRGRTWIAAAILVILALLGAILRSCDRRTTRVPGQASADRRINPELARDLANLEAREEEINRTVWAAEMVAERCGSVLDDLWDALNAATNKWAVASAVRAGEWVLPAWNGLREAGHGIRIRSPMGEGMRLDPANWRQSVATWEREGWCIANVEFRHVRFDPGVAGRSLHSDVRASVHLTNGLTDQRAMLTGLVGVDWSDAARRGGPPEPRLIDARDVVLRIREGPPPFVPVLEQRIHSPRNTQSIDPLLLHDLDGDGLSEIILAGKNLVFRRDDRGGYTSRPLCSIVPKTVTTAVLADFDGDGSVDFLGMEDGGLVLRAGPAQPSFPGPGRIVFPARREIQYPMILTCGDVDGDGDIDVFLAQYKVPYEGGAMPTPFYDANDGLPAFLLLNDGTGALRDATTGSGLERKRCRRTYSASFADLDGDADLDLVVISDFAGVDVYRNDGTGRFTDVTTGWISSPHAFGMAGALTDFNRDGRLDLLMMGMTSATASRLDHLGPQRGGDPRLGRMRSAMTYGSRLYLGNSSGGFTEPATLGHSIAPSGWSWGCAAADFDNDGFPDVYVANGLESRKSVRDYEAEYWLHDLYVGTSTNDAAAYLYYMAKFNRTRGRGQSYGGYDKNRFYLNQAGQSFLEVGHLMGVGLEQDSRNAVSDDLDGDGRMDLVVTTYGEWPQEEQTLRIYRSTLDGGNWIGVRFQEGKGAARGLSPVGARVTVSWDGKVAVREIVTGDSYRSQQAWTAHFGLGAVRSVDRVEVRWIGGRTTTIQHPAVDRYLEIPLSGL